MTITERPDIPGTYVVVSGENRYNVDLRNPWEPTCDCPNGCWTDEVCKHSRAAMAYRDGEDK